MSLLAEIYFAVFGFGPNESNPPKKDPLFAELVAFRVSAENDISITLPAIRKWFPITVESGRPTRLSALKFLNAYLLMKKKRGEIAENGIFQLHKAELSLQEQIREAETRINNELNHVVANSRHRKESHLNIAEKINAIEGSYQLIRPHTSKVKAYILEIMTIQLEGRIPVISMYSRNFASPRFLYRGNAFLTDRYCHALMQREHEVRPNQSATRSLVFDIDLRREFNGYTSRYCFAGIMLRGVTGSSNRKSAAAVPFVVIRAPKPVNMLEVKMESSLEIGSVKTFDNSILIGEVSKGRTQQFCHDIFTKLSFLNETQLTLLTASPNDVAAVINQNAEKGEDYFNKWRNEAKELYSICL